jgi:hypothetical protein
VINLAVERRWNVSCAGQPPIKSESRHKEKNSMKINKNSLVLAAAFTGLLGGTMARLNAAPASGSSVSAVLQAADSSEKKEVEKHACKGLNSCKGNGGGSKKEWGKNSCKGKGACATDGSK